MAVLQPRYPPVARYARHGLGAGLRRRWYLRSVSAGNQSVTVSQSSSHTGLSPSTESCCNKSHLSSAERRGRDVTAGYGSQLLSVSSVTADGREPGRLETRRRNRCDNAASPPYSRAASIPHSQPQSSVSHSLLHAQSIEPPASQSGSLVSVPLASSSVTTTRSQHRPPVFSPVPSIGRFLP